MLQCASALDPTHERRNPHTHAHTLGCKEEDTAREKERERGSDSQRGESSAMELIMKEEGSGVEDI